MQLYFIYILNNIFPFDVMEQLQEHGELNPNGIESRVRQQIRPISLS